MANVLLLYSTTDGQTLAISRRLSEVIESHGHAVYLVDIDQEPDPDLSAFDRVLLGARIRYGHHTPQVHEFVRRHKVLLDAKPCGFFSVCVVARKPNRNTPETNPYMQKFLKRTGWRPDHLAVFAGRVDYPRYGVLDRTMIRLIMWLTHGPTDPHATVEFTDWSAVDAFGHRFALEKPEYRAP
jgi:menaquinone-dependent protoporphyrinogen oxidase